MIIQIYNNIMQDIPTAQEQKLQLVNKEFKVLDHGFVKLLDFMGSDRDICDAARISYDSKSKTEEDDKRLIRYLFKNQHTSPFEMGKVKLHIKLPIFVMRQYVRHRMQNMNEESARYRELSNEFYLPTVWRKQDEKNKQGSITGDIDHGYCYEKLKNLCEFSYKVYEDLLKHGAAREMARMALCVNIYTETIVCWDMNNLIKYLFLRFDNHAQKEHFWYAEVIKQIAQTLFPWTLECFETALKKRAAFKEWEAIQNDNK